MMQLSIVFELLDIHFVWGDLPPHRSVVPCMIEHGFLVLVVSLSRLLVLTEQLFFNISSHSRPLSVETVAAATVCFNFYEYNINRRISVMTVICLVPVNVQFLAQDARKSVWRPASACIR